MDAKKARNRHLAIGLPWPKPMPDQPCKEGATPGVSRPEMVLAPVGMRYLAPHTVWPERSGQASVRSCRCEVPAGTGFGAVDSTGLLTLPDSNVLEKTLDDADETRLVSTTVIHSEKRPAIRAGLCLPGQWFRDWRSEAFGGERMRPVVGVRVFSPGAGGLCGLAGRIGAWR